MWGNARINTKISIYILDKCFKTVKHTGSDPMSCQISSVHHHHFFRHCSTGMWWNEKILSDSLILCNSQSGKQQQSITLQFVLPNLRVMSGENVSINFIDFLINAHYEFWCQQQVESKLGQGQQMLLASHRWTGLLITGESVMIQHGTFTSLLSPNRARSSV